MESKKRRLGVFRKGIREQMTILAALRVSGMSWSEVAAHFEGDPRLGGASRRHFSSEWSKAKMDGLAVSADEVQAMARQLRDGRGAGMLAAALGGSKVRRVSEAAVEAEPKPLPEVKDEPKDEVKEETVAQKSPVVARHQMSALAAGMQTSFAPAQRAGVQAEVNTTAKLRMMLAERLAGGEKVPKVDLMEDAGFPEWLAERVSSARWRLDVILPKLMWHTPPAQAESLAFLRVQPECTDFVPLLDSGFKSYDAAKVELERRRAEKKA